MEHMFHYIYNPKINEYILLYEHNEDSQITINIANDKKSKEILRCFDSYIKNNELTYYNQWGKLK